MDGQNSQSDRSTDDIVVTAYAPRYVAAFERLIGIEGGDTDDPVDHGGATRFGISLRFLVTTGHIDLNHNGVADFDLDMDGDIDGADIRLLKIGDARFLYFDNFWAPLACTRWAAPIGEAMFDQGVNGGLIAAKKLLQRAINLCLAMPEAMCAADHPDLLKDDGVLGDKTRGAFDWVLRRPSIGMPGLIVKYRLAAGQRYRAIVAADPTQQKYLNGWLNRASALGRF